MKYQFFSQIDSTNKYLKDNYQKLEDHTFIASFNQTLGHGRMERSWINPMGEGIALSVLLKNDKLNKINESFPLLIATILHQTLTKLYHIDIHIKWPNDLLINGKKVSGILLESVVTDRIEAVIIGIGINCNQTSFPKDIANSATSLSKEVGHNINMEYALKDIVFDLDDAITKYLDDQLDYNYIDYLKKYLYGYNKIVSFQKERHLEYGKIVDIDNDGLLVLKQNNNIIKVRSGEIKIII